MDEDDAKLALHRSRLICAGWRTHRPRRARLDARAGCRRRAHGFGAL